MQSLSKQFTVVTTIILFISSSVASQELPTFSGADREIDIRPALNRHFAADISQATQQARQQLLLDLQDASISIDPNTGVLRTLSRHTQYLTSAQSISSAPLDVGMAYINQHLIAFGLTNSDIDSAEVSDQVFTRVTGAHHIYLKQILNGIPVYNAQLQFHINRNGRLLSINNTFMPNAAQSANSSTPTLDASQALTYLANHLNQNLDQNDISVTERLSDNQHTHHINAPTLSNENIKASLSWLPIRAGDMRLVWNIQLALKHGQNHFDITVDATDGRIWTRTDWVDEASYRAFQQPDESPNHSSIAPPGDGRVLIVDPEDATASPLGWHDDGTTSFTSTRGNNVNAFDDQSNNITDCGAGLLCDFNNPIDFTLDPRDYIDASVANLFYWSNLVHDVQYQYGFDEQAGNFQANNFGNGGIGGDEITARAQSLNPAFLCPNNASFSTQPDGNNGRLAMCLFTSTPRIASSFDAGVVVHEYGHGISNRLVGGPSAASCLSGLQQAGEGYSDWWALAYTARAEHTGTTARGLGTYVIGQATTGPGIRPQPYSTDPAVNNYTYESINGIGIPHGVGSVWAQIAWEVYWSLVDEHGFDSNLHNALGGSGNQRAMLYVNEGLKMVPCGLTFADIRDGMIQVAMDNFEGEDVCTLWETFSAYGLGTDADPANPSSLNVSNGFSLPLECVENEDVFINGFETNMP